MGDAVEHHGGVVPRLFPVAFRRCDSSSRLGSSAAYIDSALGAEPAMRQMNLSARGYHRVLKLARTIADLAGCDQIEATHLAEALQYRPKML